MSIRTRFSRTRLASKKAGNVREINLNYPPAQRSLFGTYLNVDRNFYSVNVTLQVSLVGICLLDD